MKIKNEDITLISDFYEVQFDNIYNVPSKSLIGLPIKNNENKIIGRITDVDEDLIYGIIYSIYNMFDKKDTEFEITMEDNNNE